MDFLELYAHNYNRALSSAGVLLTCSVLIGFLSYRLGVVRKPRVIGLGPWKETLLQKCPILKQQYWPTFWAFPKHLSTICRALLQQCPNLQYKREVLSLADGGEVALDWGIREEQSLSEQDLPVLLILPGITGYSSKNYVMHLVQDGLVAGYRPVVFNQRGIGGMKLKTPRVYCASNIDDLLEVVHHIEHTYPNSKIVGVGVSLGGMLLVQYQHRLGRKCTLAAVIACSASWDPHVTARVLETQFFNNLFYSRTLANDLKDLFNRHRKELPQEELLKMGIDVEKVEKARVVSEFDAGFTVPMFGYSSLDEYYNDSCNKDKVHKIQTPLVCITAADDPFIPPESLPLEEFKANPNTVMVLTAHGGHFGFVEGIYPNGLTWMNRTLRQLITAIKDI